DVAGPARDPPLDARPAPGAVRGQAPVEGVAADPEDGVGQVDLAVVRELQDGCLVRLKRGRPN
ncbi:hypothetical protein THAOC_20123, partial [Thalassiosira oceanica]